jgi:hypothetical protein
VVEFDASDKIEEPQCAVVGRGLNEAFDLLVFPINDGP